MNEQKSMNYLYYLNKNNLIFKYEIINIDIYNEIIINKLSSNNIKIFMYYIRIFNYK